MVHLANIIFFVILFSQFVVAQKKITVEDFLKFHYPYEFTVSPDRQKFVYTVKSADFEKSHWQKHLWLLDINESKSRQLTFRGANDYSPKWSPDGDWVAFLSDRIFFNHKGEKIKGIPQLWALPMVGGEAQRFSDLETGVEDYRWSYDGQFIILRASEDKPNKIKNWIKEREQLKFDEIVQDSVYEKKVFWYLNFHTKIIQKIAVCDPGVREFSISHNGNWIVYQTNYSGQFDDEQKFDLWLLNIQTGEKKQLTNFPGPETDPKFSPDDQWITYINQTTPDIEFAERDLNCLKFDITTSRPDTRNLTKNFNLSVLDYQWDAIGSYIILRIAEGTETHLYRTQLFEKRIPSKLTPSGINVTEYQKIDEEIYYLCEDATHLPEIARNNKPKPAFLSNFSDQLNSFKLGTQLVYRWKSIDGEQIEGLLFLPPNFDATQKYPLILMVHGGPYGRVRQAIRQSHYKQLYSSDGYVILAPNPRGSSGYDDAFGKAIWYKEGGSMGGIDYHDIMAGVNALIQEGYIDEKRMGVMGGSYGGYLTNWIISQTNRFTAAVSQFGIFSFFTDWSNSWQPAFEKMYFGIYYWERPMNDSHPYVRWSPAFYVENITTPVLILQGEKDRYTNLANSREMYQALKALDREVKFVVYPRENHGISKEPNHRRDVAKRSKKWFDRRLKKQ